MFASGIRYHQGRIDEEFLFGITEIFYQEIGLA